MPRHIGCMWAPHNPSRPPRAHAPCATHCAESSSSRGVAMAAAADWLLSLVALRRAAFEPATVRPASCSAGQCTAGAPLKAGSRGPHGIRASGDHS
jgi:hypothetical protein